MKRYIDLNGNTWDGMKLTSKIRHDDRYGAFITVGWLFSDSVPVLDLEAHDKEVQEKAIDTFTEEAMKQFTEFDLKHGYPTVTDCKIILKEIAEQMKEVE